MFIGHGNIFIYKNFRLCPYQVLSFSVFFKPNVSIWFVSQSTVWHSNHWNGMFYMTFWNRRRCCTELFIILSSLFNLVSKLMNQNEDGQRCSDAWYHKSIDKFVVIIFLYIWFREWHIPKIYKKLYECQNKYTHFQTQLFRLRCVVPYKVSV